MYAELNQNGIKIAARSFSVWSHIISMIYCHMAHCISFNDICDKISDIVISVLVVSTVDGGFHQLGAGVVGEDIVHHSTLAGGIASGRAAKGIVAVLALYY